MRIVFMGTPEFAVPSLDTLLRHGYEIVGVVTAPDKPAGRGQQLQQSAVKKYALERNLKILQPEYLKDENFIKELKSLKAELQIVVAFRMLPESVWNMPEHGTYNLHASLLPKYRGAAPINWAIINGEKETGITSFKLKHEIDTGNILFNQKVEIQDTTTAGELHDLLMAKGAEMVLRTVNEISQKAGKEELRFMTQDETVASHAPKIFKETCRINWNRPVKEVYNLIRGLSPYPTAFTEIRNGGEESQVLKIYKASYQIADHDKPNGSVYTDNKTFLHIYCLQGIIEIKDLQLQGKKRMPVIEFLRGFKIKEDAKVL